MVHKALTGILLAFLISTCQSQDNRSKKPVGGPCEGCEAIHEYGQVNLSPVDTLPEFQKTEPKLKLTGTVYEKDGVAPASNVILYIYQTNRGGIYPTNGSEKGWAKRHGYIRGWVKTGRDGRYTFYTFRPGAYPNRRAQEHIHITIKEPAKNEYYIDEFVFDDDPLLTDRIRNNARNRGGSGISTLVFKEGILAIERDIVLGLNIPNYK
ncbi:MAG: intradiol ring-cleavage dioxygenase [Cyclobacteriaceae bacterium]